MINQKATAILFLITVFYKENTIAFEPEGSEVNGVFDWQGQKDLNPRHAVLETAALPAELYPYINKMVGHQGLEPGTDRL